MATNKTITVTTVSTVTGDTLASYNAYSDIDGLLGSLSIAEAAAGKVFALSDGVEHSITVKPVGTSNGEFSSVSSNAVSVDLSSGLLSGLIFSLDHNGTNFINAVDDTVMTNNGSVALASPVVTGSSDAGTFVTASTKYLSTPSTGSLTGFEDFTVAAWVNLTTTNQQQVLAGQYLSTGDQRGWNISTNSNVNNYAPTLTISGDGTSTVTQMQHSIGQLSASTAYFIVAWHDSTNDLIWVQVNNGTPESAAYSAGLHDSTGNLTIGAMDNPLLYSDGDISVDIWNRVLTAQERTDLYNSGSGVKYPTYA